MTISQPFLRAVSRRPSIEQKVLTILRGDQSSIDGDQRLIRRQTHGPVSLSAQDWTLFQHLRDRARAHGMRIRMPSAPFVHDDELQLLAWLAHGQRVSGDQEPADVEQGFLDLILDCSRVLDRRGLRLPPRSLLNR
ncbi:MAG: hypothetical protein I8H86_00885 [Sphingomonadaceae bacterium]|nr:hypothetical protein [Sphingomonadaceae bacterium]